MTALLVRSCGPMTGLQDVGRFGWQRHGVASSGAMDRLALAAANTLVGNAPGTAVIEFILFGGEFTLEGGTARVAATGASAPLALNGDPATAATSFLIHEGQTLTVGATQTGVYMYLAVAGGLPWSPSSAAFRCMRVPASAACRGRRFRLGTTCRSITAMRRAGMSSASTHSLLITTRRFASCSAPQADYFTSNGLDTFLSATYRVTPEADRMGYRLTGEKIEHALGYNIISDGIATGAVQVPGTGEPIVMMADRQTTGGYPKIATVISPDLRVLAQRRPGASVRFQAIDIAEAQRLARHSAEFIATLPLRARPRSRGLPENEKLFALNLAGSAVDALKPD